MGNKVLAFRFDFFRRYRNATKLNYSYLKGAIHSLVVQTCFAVPYGVLDKIRADGERL
mgnify:FL=1